MRLIELIKAISIAMIICSTQMCSAWGFDAVDSQVDYSLIGDLDCDGSVTMNEIRQLNIDLLQGKVSYDIVYKAIKNFEAKKNGAGTTYSVQPTNIENYMQRNLNQEISGCQSNFKGLALASPPDSLLVEKNNCRKISKILETEIPWIEVGSTQVVPPIRVGNGNIAKSDPLPLSSSTLSTFVIRYNTIGRHIMLMPVYAERMAFQRHDQGMLGQKGNAYFFGKDFSLGTIDNNYGDAPFITQFLADP
jgi:hypothetical protein